MKASASTSAPSPARRRLSGSVRALRLLVTLAGVGVMTHGMRAQENQLDVGVRPTVVDTSNIHTGKSKIPNVGGHSKIYGILSVQEIKSDQKLVKPVDENAIMQILSQELNANGFKLYAPNTKPEIILTVSYGRGELHNPYIRDQGETPLGAVSLPPPPDGGSTNANDSGATSVTITGASPLQLYDEKTPGWEAKLQKAAYEKLYIRVTAFSYPKDSKTKPRMLWKTVMVVDDPDHRDLNAVAAKMLEAGAPYFDKEVMEPEVEVHKPLPEGHVNVGTPVVGEPFGPKPK